MDSAPVEIREHAAVGEHRERLLAGEATWDDAAGGALEHDDVGEVSPVVVEAEVGVLAEIAHRDEVARDVGEALLTRAADGKPRARFGGGRVVEPYVGVVRHSRSVPRREDHARAARTRLARSLERTARSLDSVGSADAHHRAAVLVGFPGDERGRRGRSARMLARSRDDDLGAGGEIADDEVAGGAHVRERATSDRIRREAIEVVARHLDVGRARRIASDRGGRGAAVGGHRGRSAARRGVRSTAARDDDAGERGKSREHSKRVRSE